jgi:hypothetical protein
MIPPISLIRFRMPSLVFGMVAFAVAFTVSASLDLARDEDRGAARASGFAPWILSVSDVERLLVREGYRDIGHVQRTGAIFIAQATGPDGARKTLVVTARDGLLVGDGPIADRRAASREPVAHEE